MNHDVHFLGTLNDGLQAQFGEPLEEDARGIGRGGAAYPIGNDIQILPREEDGGSSLHGGRVLEHDISMGSRHE